MEFTYETPDGNGGLRHLERVDRSCMPRIGETVLFRGPEYGDEDCEATYFRVAAINHGCGNPTDDPVVVVEIDEQDELFSAVFVPRCTCEGQDRKPRHDGICNGCNGRSKRCEWERANNARVGFIEQQLSALKKAVYESQFTTPGSVERIHQACDLALDALAFVKEDIGE